MTKHCIVNKYTVTNVLCYQAIAMLSNTFYQIFQPQLRRVTIIGESVSSTNSINSWLHTGPISFWLVMSMDEYGSMSMDGPTILHILLTQDYSYWKAGLPQPWNARYQALLNIKFPSLCLMLYKCWCNSNTWHQMASTCGWINCGIKWLQLMDESIQQVTSSI